MPRIDPSQLLKCLSVLLSSNGGIKSKDEVNRIANLMTKFSKKLVSKCIYVLILKSTEIDILDMFMSAGGWDLIFTWLSDGITVRNWPLVEEIVELLLLCPVNIQRLKGNNCPKIIKSLSKDVGATEKVRELACEVVEQWLAIVKGACEATSSYQQQQAAATSAVSLDSGSTTEQINTSTIDEDISKEATKGDDPLPVYKITIRDGKQVLAEVISDKTGSRVDNTPKPEEDSSKGSDEAEAPQVTAPVEAATPAPKTRRPARNRKARVLDELSESETESSDDDFQTPRGRKRIQVKAGPKTPQSKKKKADEKKPTKEEKPKKPAIVRTRAPEHHHKPDIKKVESAKLVKHEVKSSKAEREMHDKDRATLAKLITPSISSMGRIPKKNKDGEKKDEKKDDKKEEPKKEHKKEEKKPEKKPVEAPKPAPKDPKKYNYSTEIRKHDTERPKTIVKTFNSKFRSTGLEETPPPPKKKVDSVKSHDEVKRSPKRLSPLKDVPVPEKKAKHHEHEKSKEKGKEDEKKVTSPKPKTLQESDMFADALTAANTFKDNKKRKRRPSNSSSGKDERTKDSSPPKKPHPIKEESEDSEVQEDSKDAITKKHDVKPNLRFYQETLESLGEGDGDHEGDHSPSDTASVKKEVKQEPDDEGGVSPVKDEDLEDEITKTEAAISKQLQLEEWKNVEREKNRLVSGILVYVRKRKTIKKTVQWRPQQHLIETKYFELDETERVNVTKTFMDMKQMERINEREQLMLSRKLAANDIMEERMAWRPLIPIDILGDIVEPGKNSLERDVQFQRERTIVPAIYFNKKLIPDSPAEPDLEIHAITEPIMIPLMDQTGNTESVISYKAQGWPEPLDTPPEIVMPMPEIQQPMPPPGAPIMMPPTPPGIPSLLDFNRVPATGFYPPQMPPMGPQVPPAGMMPPPMWVNGDVNAPMMAQPPPDMMMPPPGAMMAPPPDMGPQFPMNPMNQGPMGPMGQFMGPPQGFQPQPGPPPGPPQGQQMYQDGPPPPRNNRPWYNNNNNNNQGGGGGGGGGGQWRKGGGGGNWGSGKKSGKTCLNIIKRGFCKMPHCQFKHPPPYKHLNS